MKTVLVTGGCGFIGAHFVRLVLREAGWRVVNVDKLTYAGDLERLHGIEVGNRYRFVKGDIGERDLLEGVFRDETPWAVVNFAAESHVDRSILNPLPFLHTNVLGVHALLEAARSHSTERFVQISTDEVYGDNQGQAPFAEDSPLRPSSPYAASKAAADLLCMAYQRTYGLRVLVVRCCNNYGPFQFPEKLIPFMIVAGLNGEELPVYGDGGQERDWLHVEDACRAILAALDRGRLGSIYNVEAGKLETNLDIVRAVCRVLADEARLDAGALLGRIRFITDRPGHDRCYEMDSHRVREELGWSPHVPFESGLRQTVRWYLDHQDWVKRVTSGEYRTYHEAVYQLGWKLQ